MQNILQGRQTIVSQPNIQSALLTLHRYGQLVYRSSRKSNQHFVATIGKINVYPNSAAIIPGLVELTIDLRAVSKNSRDEFINTLEKLKRKVIKKLML